MKALLTPFLLLLATIAACSANAQVFTLLEINPAGNSNPAGFAEYNGKLYFRASDGTHGAELWVTDGTPAGTTMVKDIRNGSGDGYPQSLTVFNGKLYFYASTAANGGELWTSDGTAAGTSMVKDINSGTGDSDPNNFTVVNGKLIFTANDGASGSEIWSTDGTAAGTAILKDINAGSGGSVPHGLTLYNGKLYFIAETVTNNQEMWMTDGTGAGTTILKDIQPGPTGSFPDPPAIFNGKLYFAAKDSVNGREIWMSDGTTAGTQLLSDVIPGVWGQYPAWLYGWNGKLWYNGYGQANLKDNEVWTTDGTAAGTQLFKDINPGVNANSNAQYFFGLGGRLYFSATHDAYGTEPWVSDGTPAGTTMLKNINPRVTPMIGSSGPAYFFAYNNKVFFTASDSIGKRKMFRTDGTTAGTQPLELGTPGDTSKNASDEHIVFNGTLYLSISMANSSGTELWKYSDTTTSSPTGVGQQAVTQGPQVFPNPAQNRIYFGTNTPLDAAIYSADGRLVLEQKAVRSMDISTLPSGLYFIALKAGQESPRIVRRLVKE